MCFSILDLRYIIGHHSLVIGHRVTIIDKLTSMREESILKHNLNLLRISIFQRCSEFS